LVLNRHPEKVPIRSKPAVSAHAPQSGVLGSSRGEVVALKPYAIGTAARLAGIAPETLRMWDRRYQILELDRTGGGHRLYSEADVELLRAVKQLVDSGMRVGSVARLGREDILNAAERLAPATSFRNATHELIEEIIVASSGLDPQHVGPLLDRPLLVMTGEDAILTVFLPLLALVGERWHAGLLPISVEHFIEKMVTARIHAVLQATAQPTGGRLAIVAGIPDERHEVGLLTAAVMLRKAGFVVSFLGADLPASDLVAAIATLAPSLLVLAVVNEPSLAARDLAKVLNRQDVPLVLGGAMAKSFATLLDRPFEIAGQMESLPALARRIAR
jgi:MerR family transcriptional regulator, light-induced transcriptional regulator